MKIQSISTNRNFGLDLMRAIAILLVLHTHSRFLWEETDGIKHVHIFDGVELFFVLSGFLIGSIMIRMYLSEPGMTLKKQISFWKRRWMRTLPLYFFMLLVNILLNHFLFQEPYKTPLWKFFFFGQNLLGGQEGYFFLESWSLTIEEWFYILSPFIFLLATYLMSRFKFRISPLKVSFILSFMFALFFVFVRYKLFQKTGMISDFKYDIFYRKMVITRLDSIMYGVLMAHLSYMYPVHWKKLFRFLIIPGLILMVIVENGFLTSIYGFKHVWAFCLTGIGMACLIPFLFSLKRPNAIIIKIVTFISVTSYSAYLLHLPILKIWETFFSNELNINSYLSFIIFLSIVFIMSFISYQLIELPFLKLREKRLYSIKSLKA